MNVVLEQFRKVLSEEMKKKADDRLTICKSCDRFDHEKKQCKECMCFMEFKTLIPNVECPIGKWK